MDNDVIIYDKKFYLSTPPLLLGNESKPFSHCLEHNSEINFGPKEKTRLKKMTDLWIL